MRDSLPRRSTTLRWPRRSSPSSRTPRFSNLFREQELRKHWQPAPRRVESSGDSIKKLQPGGAVAQLGARLDGIEEVVGSNPIGSTNLFFSFQSDSIEPLSEPTRCGGPYVRPAFACIHRLP